MADEDNPPGESAGSTMTEYVVVARAQSAARFLPEEGWELNLDAVPGLQLGAVRVRTFTRWVAAGDDVSVPRELIVEVRGHASSLEEAVVKFDMVVRPIATMVGFVANVRVGALEVHVAYECTAGRGERRFLETFLPDERGGLSDGRIIRQSLLIAACTAFLALDADSSRVSRGLRQYELALREWYLGGEWLALSHLYMAVEALTKAVIRKAVADRGITEEDLAQSLGVVTDDPDRPRWRQILGEQAREQLIFDGDSDTYKTAKAASDGLEHGYLELDTIAAHALKCADKTFRHVRRTIIDLLGISPEDAAGLLATKPMDVQSRRKIARGRLVGNSDNLAAEGELYPLLGWSSSIESMVREGSTFRLGNSEKITVRTHPDISFRLDRIEVYGRLEDGQARVEVSTPDALVGPTPEPKSTRMLAAAAQLVDAATADATDTESSLPRVLAFNLFGQGVASFEAAYRLIIDQRPVEALPVLRNLVIIAARFEQITAPNGGTGIAVRLALGMPAELGASPEVAAQYRDHLIAAAAAAGVAIPDELTEPSATAIYASLDTEMRLARSAVDGTYAAIGPHTREPATKPLGFHTRLEPGPFTELIASACVVALLDMLRHAASVFGWTVNGNKIGSLLQQARELNETSAGLQIAEDMTGPDA